MTNKKLYISDFTRQSNYCETKLGNNDQEASPSAGKNTKIVLVPCRAWKCIPTAISGGVDIFEVLRRRLLRQMSSQ